MKNKDFLSILDLGDGEVDGIISKAASIKQGNTPQILSGKTVALVFEKPSLRTRVSFEVGVKQMGGTCIFLSNNEIGLGVREPEADVAKVLDRLVDCVVARVFSHHSLELLAENTTIPIVNALSDQAHPCQALGDCLTIYERKGGLEGLKLAFVGDGNNIAGSLALACSSAGMDFNIASPPDYRLPEDIWNQARIMAKKRGTTIRWTEDPEDAVSEADVVYTDVWVSMGDEEEKKERISFFSSYQVNEQLVKFAKDDFLFMHDMPAHRGEEISEGMLEHPNSVVYHQAENRLHAQKAVLAELFGY
jgi:ornithine carbamoyltransferase